MYYTVYPCIITVSHLLHIAAHSSVRSGHEHGTCLAEDAGHLPFPLSWSKHCNVRRSHSSILHVSTGHDTGVSLDVGRVDNVVKVSWWVGPYPARCGVLGVCVRKLDRETAAGSLASLHSLCRTYVARASRRALSTARGTRIRSLTSSASDTPRSQ